MTAPVVRTLPEAVAAHVTDGATVYVGNFGAQLFAVAHEMIRQGRRDLHAIVTSGGILLDQLLGAGVVGEATFAHCWSPVGPAPAYNFRRLAEGGGSTVRLHEMTIGLITAALTAGAWGVPFAAVRDLPGTGFADDDWTDGMLAVADSPFGSAPVVRALVPDVAFVHADLADRYGNARLPGPCGETPQAAQAARRVVVVTEELAEPDAVRRAGVDLPGLLVDTVVVAPGAVRPDGVPGRYPRAVRAYEDYARAAATADGFTAWLGDTVLGEETR